MYNKNVRSFNDEVPTPLRPARSLRFAADNETAPRPDRRQAILLAAEKLFAQRGYHAVTIRQIADEAGVPMALVGYHYGQKHESFEATFERWSPTIDERLTGLHAAVDAGGPELLRIGHTLSPLEIVVVNTRAGKRYGQPDDLASGCGMGYEATMYLLERGVRLTGTDAWSRDAPFVHAAQKYGATHDASLIREGHKAGRDIGYCHLEKLHNLEVLPPSGFYISCFPHRIRGASAGWTRAVVIFDDRLTAF